METKIVYHYSFEPFDKFDITKADGFWFTTIKPNETEMLEEIGADCANYAAKCEISFDNPLLNASNYDVEKTLAGSEHDAIENRYEGYIDYALIDSEKIKIIEWSKI